MTEDTEADYTPTTATVRDCYMSLARGRGTFVLAEFDRWLASVQREAAANAWDEGQGAGTVAAVNFTPLEPNPYREGKR